MTTSHPTLREFSTLWPPLTFITSPNLLLNDHIGVNICLWKSGKMLIKSGKVLMESGKHPPPLKFRRGILYYGSQFDGPFSFAVNARARKYEIKEIIRD